MSILCTPDNLHIIVYAFNDQQSETPRLRICASSEDGHTAKSELALID